MKTQTPKGCTVISKPYRSTMTFTDVTLPAALTRTHMTKEGAWGVLSVLEGSLRYVIEDGSGVSVVMKAGGHAIILPEQPHHVEIIGPVRALVEFYDHEPVIYPGSGAAESGPSGADERQASHREIYLRGRQLDEVTVIRVVDAFYARVRKDDLLGTIFAAAIGDDWDRHLQVMYDFWTTIMLMSARYKGSPMHKHVAMTGLNAVHFDRWLQLFEATVTEICADSDAALFMQKGSMIARSFQHGIEVARGELPPRTAAV